MQDLPDWIGSIVESLTHERFAIADDVLPTEVIARLREEAPSRDGRGLMHDAAVGRAAAHRVASEIRGDRIGWLEECTANPAERAYLAAMHGLRDALNRELMAGAVELEAHYAIYPPGARYARHHDRFRDDDARIVSLVLYLNENWSPGDGGALRIYDSDQTYHETYTDVMPEGGLLVAFASDRFAHEVLPASRERIAIAGWLRRRSASSWRR